MSTGTGIAIAGGAAALAATLIFASANVLAGLAVFVVIIAVLVLHP